MTKLIAALIAATFSLGAFAAGTPATLSAPAVTTAKDMKSDATQSAKKAKKAKKTKKVEKAA